MNSLYISEIKYTNFRKFKDLSIGINDSKNIFVGKNNTGKTSLVKGIEIFENKMLKNTDINALIIQKIIDNIKNNNDSIDDIEIALKLQLNYNENCDFGIVSKYMDKISVNGKINLKYQYKISQDKVDYYKNNIGDIENNTENYIQNNLIDMFEYKIFLNEKEQSQNNRIKVSDILNIKYISANRKVDNDTNNKVNSQATQSVLDSGIEEIKSNEELRDIIVDAEINSNILLNSDNFFINFKTIIDDLTGLVGEDKPNISIDYSTILKNPKVKLSFENNGILIPEYNSGLGYANFYSLLLNIIYFVDTINSKNIKNSFLIIEEPEAYSHPQMQYIFNENIDRILKKTLNEGLEIQYIIVTHSPQIVTTSAPNDIIILKEKSNDIIAKNFKDLIDGDEKFFRQYFKLTNSELLFTDKVIFIEGGTEEILIKEFFEKYDDEIKQKKEVFLSTYNEEYATEDEKEQKVNYDRYIPLMKQSISILPVGTQANKFKKIIKELEIKTLIITDIDFVKKNRNNEDSRYIKCTFSESESTSNPTIKDMILEEGNVEFQDYKSDINNWERDNIFVDENIAITHQKKTTYKIEGFADIDYYPRTFEDSFFMTNYNLIKGKNELKELYSNGKEIFSVDFFSNPDSKYEEILLEVKGKEKYKKVGLGFQFLQSEENWEIPQYIKKGLEWLQEE